MEVKIKNETGLVDATIEMVDGIMVVSPKVEKFEPKDGDVVYVKSSWDNIIIYKEDVSGIGRYVNLSDNKYLYTDNNVVCDKDSVEEIRYTTEEEKKKLFDKLAEKGYEWDADTKELVKLKWKPKYDDNYWSPSLFNSEFIPWKNSWRNSTISNKRLEKGWVFKTKGECQEFCDKLNQAIERIKP